MTREQITQFDPSWMIDVIKQSAVGDSYLQKHPEVIKFLVDNLPKCQVHNVRLNPDYDSNVNFYFVDPTNPNQPGSAWKFKDNVTIYGSAADLIIDILDGDRLGSVEVWYHPKKASR